MAIAAQRFNFLDKETNVPILDFTKLSDNFVYNTVDQLTKTTLESNKDLEANLETLQKGMSELNSMVENSFNEIGDTLKETLNSAIDTISNMELPDVAKDIFNSLKELDTSGLKSFLKELLNIGSVFLCNNLDFLKLFMLGFSINGNILSGLLIALLLSWLDRYCKEFTKEEIAKSNNRNKIDMMFPPKGVNVTSDNVFTLFTNYYGDYLKANQPYSLSNALNPNDFIANIINGDIDSSILNLKNSEINSTEKNLYLNTIDSNLSNYTVGSQEYNNLLNARGKLLNTAFINNTRRENSIKYEYLSDKFGSFVKNLVNVDIKPLNLINATTIEKNLFNKLIQLKSSASENNNLLIRNNTTGSYKDFDFNSILPSISQEETDYILDNNKETDSHRLYDLHPTSTILLRA